MTVVLTYGTFDLFHVGHVKILERARALGTKLYVGVSSDEFNIMKGKRSIMPYEHRSTIVSSMKYVDHVFPETTWEQKADDIKRLNANVLVMGDDWQGKFDHFKSLCDVTYLTRTDGISTTQLKSALAAFRGDKIDELQRALDVVRQVVEQLGR